LLNELLNLLPGLPVDKSYCADENCEDHNPKAADEVAGKIVVRVVLDGVGFNERRDRQDNNVRK